MKIISSCPRLIPHLLCSMLPNCNSSALNVSVIRNANHFVSSFLMPTVFERSSRWQMRVLRKSSWVNRNKPMYDLSIDKVMFTALWPGFGACR